MWRGERGWRGWESGLGQRVAGGRNRGVPEPSASCRALVAPAGGLRIVLLCKPMQSLAEMRDHQVKLYAHDLQTKLRRRPVSKKGGRFWGELPIRYCIMKFGHHPILH